MTSSFWHVKWWPNLTSRSTFYNPIIHQHQYDYYFTKIVGVRQHWASVCPTEVRTSIFTKKQYYKSCILFVPILFMVFITRIKLGTTIFYLETMQWYLRMRWKSFHWPWTSGLALVRLGYAPDDQFSAGKLRFCHTELIMLTFGRLVDLIWSIHLYLINYFSWCRSKFGSNGWIRK